MPIKISAKLRAAIADQNALDREDVEEALVLKSGGVCWLCDHELNVASDDIEVDHDTSVDEGGTEVLSNMNLSHTECNRFKRAHSSRDVRNLLRFKRFYTSAGGSIDYTKALEFFGVSPKPSRLELSKGTIKFHLPDGSTQSVPLFSASHGGSSFEYCFVSLPIESIFNDDDVQPRLIKLNHAFSIAFDLAKNPLHEAPAARITGQSNGLVKISMFDGQHKAIASWLQGESKLVFKVYTNISREQATKLVNSIQSKIKKLPLTPFELASKLSDEYADKLDIYEGIVGEDNVSEEGFVNWLPAAQRASAKKEIEAAVLKDIADDSGLLITEIVEMRGRAVPVRWKITETTFQNKALKELAFTKPLPSHPYKGALMQAARVRERQTIVRCLNLLFEKVYADLDASSSASETERARRMSYQGALLYAAKLIKKIVTNRVVPTSEDLAFIEKAPSEEQWAAIVQAVERLATHPVWTADFESGDKMRAVHEALTKNQNVEVALKDVDLTPSYCLGL
ncbi:HNH endonuclease signature motif containing protein [Brevundimonas sp.]|uniref:HNH endonuclease signature motif containing protein n=1 Tax=Brevundimonas sp. TaxID=1871086 RepID=UPI003511D357